MMPTTRHQLLLTDDEMLLLHKALEALEEDTQDATEEMEKIIQLEFLIDQKLHGGD